MDVGAGVVWASAMGLAYLYVGYPALMAVRAQVRTRPVRSGSSLPTVSLLIAAHNEADVIGRKLANVRELDYPADLLEVIVVDDGSTDGTADIVRREGGDRVRLLSTRPRSGKMSAVNRGVAEASGDIVVLSDASPSYSADALKVAVRNFADPEVGVVSGQIRLFDSDSAVERPAGLYWRYEDALRRWESQTGSTVAVNGNLFAFRRHTYEPLPPGTINDEFTTAMRLARRGWRVVYEPAAVTYDDASVSMDDEFARRARINAGRYQTLAGLRHAAAPRLLFRLISHKYSRLLAPLLMVALLLGTLERLVRGVGGEETARAAYLHARGPVALALAAGQAALYGSAALGALVERHGVRCRLLSVPHYFVSANLAGLVGLYRHLRRSQRVTWEKRVAASASVPNQPVQPVR